MLELFHGRLVVALDLLHFSSIRLQPDSTIAAIYEELIVIGLSVALECLQIFRVRWAVFATCLYNFGPARGHATLKSRDGLVAHTIIKRSCCGPAGAYCRQVVVRSVVAHW